MAAKSKIEYADLGQLFLDPLNPRLGRHFTETKPNQNEVLERMKLYTLDELAVSFIDSGFWSQEPLIVVNEPLPGSRNKTPKLIVVEGNRRLATAKLLIAASDGEENSKKWREYATVSAKESIDDLRSLPYMVAKSRKEVDAYLGFRHVTGIKEWSPGEKAEFIEKLVDSGKTYRDVARMIGSNVDTVRRNYISFKLVKNMEEAEDAMPVKDVEDRFSILSLALRTGRIQKFLGINGKAEPEEAKRPPTKEILENLRDFTTWAFGNREKKIEPVLPESRDIESFGMILESPEAVAYMRESDKPSFDVAYRIAGGDVSELIKTIRDASYEIQKALSTIHHHAGEKEVVSAVEKLTTDFKQMLISFPDVRKRHFLGGSDAQNP